MEPVNKTLTVISWGAIPIHINEGHAAIPGEVIRSISREREHFLGGPAVELRLLHEQATGVPNPQRETPYRV